MMDYNKLFKPFEREGYPLEKVIDWLETTTGADKQIIEQVVSDTMLLVSQGEKFEVEEAYKAYPDMAISHYMEANVRSLMLTIQDSKVKILQEVESLRLEKRMKEISKTNKDLDKMYNGTFWNKVKKFVGAKYTKWENE